jgi:hypothetical protein
MIKPTIGRQVLVYRGRVSYSDQFEPASICYVHSDELINVGGFTALGEPFSLVSIKLVQDPIADNPSTADLTGEPFACWMPWQRAQAALAPSLLQGETNELTPFGSETK